MKRNLVTILVFAGLLCTGVQAQDIYAYSWPPQTGGYLGVTLRDVTAEDVADLGLRQESGVLIQSVLPDTPAEEANLKEGDVVLSFAGQPVLSVRQFQRLVADTPAGRTVSLETFRNGVTETASVTIGKRKGMMSSLEGLKGLKDLEHLEKFDIEIPDIHIEPGRQVYAYVNRPRLGIRGESLTEQMAEFLSVPGGEGILIMEVLEGTPAESAGLRAGDVITDIDGNAVESISDLTFRLKPGSHELNIVRNKASETISVEISKPKEKQIKKLESGSIKM